MQKGGFAEQNQRVRQGKDFFSDHGHDLWIMTTDFDHNPEIVIAILEFGSQLGKL
jgi:hypothetical protein